MSRGDTCIGMHIVKGGRKANTNCVYCVDGICGKLGGGCCYYRCNVCKYKQTSINTANLKKKSDLNPIPVKKDKKETPSIKVENNKVVIKGKNKKQPKNLNTTSSKIVIEKCNSESFVRNGVVFRINDVILFRGQKYIIHKIYSTFRVLAAYQNGKLVRYINFDTDYIIHSKI